MNKYINLIFYLLTVNEIYVVLGDQENLNTYGIRAIHSNAFPNEDLEQFTVTLIDKLLLTNDVKCICIICDSIYLNIFQSQWFRNLRNITYVMIVVTESEDLLSPNFNTLQSIILVRKEGCELYFIFISNGIQASRLLKFGDKYRVLDTRAKYVLLHDFRLFNSNMHYIWKRIINVIFIKHYIKHMNSWFELSTIPFPAPFNGVLITKRIETWKINTHLKVKSLFTDRTFNLKGYALQITAIEHTPAVEKRKVENVDVFGGIEAKVMQTISKAMNFIPVIYEPPNAKREKWGYKYLNGTFSGLLGEMVHGKADIALGNLHYTPYHLQLIDLSIPYISQCLTFLTPESLTDNSWKTLILPFKLYMWIAVLILLFLSGFIFYGLAKFHKTINVNNITNLKHNQNDCYDDHNRKTVGLYLFEELPNSILYTFGMLLVVSLPKLPPAWSIRLLTGWYWLYCVLVVVSYRASMTAILANPAPRVTIDTMQELANNPIICGGWGEQTKEFFLASLDEVGQKIGQKYQKINDANIGVEQVAKGKLAYYENVHFLNFISAKQKNKYSSKSISDDGKNSTNNDTSDMFSVGDRNLHIMKECAIHMPISIGLQKNSPLKPQIDLLLRKIIEAGLVEKWLNDVMTPILATSQSNEENIKAVMNLQKLYGGFVALGIGYGLSIFTLIGEIIYWKYIVTKDPNFDIYALDVYYSRKKQSNFLNLK
ncbi:ionotropic receptor 21a-like [Arctopsyche grandis]|uniref:ionotropic receptor 21a-like n=1 Tax=Arctopsyche grandis TaxID=121162 RepID=UPI00406D6546